MANEESKDVWSLLGRTKREKMNLEIQVENLAMLLRRGIHSHPEENWARQAMTYLEKHNLNGSVLRTGAPADLER